MLNVQYSYLTVFSVNFRTPIFRATVVNKTGGSVEKKCSVQKKN
jgi:hypothetical protein